MDFFSFEHPSYARGLGELQDYTVSDYTPEPYSAPSAISKAHRQPRYGHTKNFETLIDGGQEEMKDYILGIIIGAMIILGVAILWFFVIVVLKVLGQKKVGFFAGRLVPPNESSKGIEGNEEKGGVEVVMGGGQPSNQDKENDINEGVPVNSTNNATDDHHTKKFMRSVWLVRVLFVLSGIVVIISGGLFYGMGIASFKNSIDEVRLGIGEVQNAALKTIKLTENVIQAEGGIEDEIEPTQEITAQNDGQICGLDSDTSALIRTAYDGLISNVDSLRGMIEGSLASFNHDLKSLLTLTEQVESGLDSADIVFYILLVISIILIGIIVAMLVGVFFAWKGVSNGFTKCIQYAIIWPLFVFLLVLSWIFATLFLTLSLAGADFCISPDQNVQAFLNKSRDQFDGIILGFVLFYVSGCTIKPVGDVELSEIARQANTVLLHAHDLVEALGDLPTASLVVICGFSAPQAAALQRFITFSHDATHVLNRAIVGLRDVLACETFNPIYTTFVHKALCVQGVSGLRNIFATTLVISIFSMIMIMFRAALYPIKEPGVQPVSRNDNAMEVVEHNTNSPGEENIDGEEQAVVY